MNKTAILLLLLVSCVAVEAQTPLWVNQIGGVGESRSHACAIAPNGNIYATGTFTATVDLDPSAGVYNITSKGQHDIFLACYNDAGNFVWGFGIGGSGDEQAQNITIDQNNNCIMVGQFRGTVDFNPATGTSNLISYGLADGFISKYNSAGVYNWAVALGGNTEYDVVQSVTTDNAGNVYAGGNFHYTMDTDPSGRDKLPEQHKRYRLPGKIYARRSARVGFQLWGRWCIRCR